MPRKVVDEKLLTIPEVKKLLEELGPGAGGDFFMRTYDYVSRFSKIGPSEARELVEKLVNEFGISEREAVQIVNYMPKTPEELKIFLRGHKAFFSKEKLKKIIDLLDHYRRGEVG